MEEKAGINRRAHLNKWVFACGAAITLVGLGIYLSEYYAIPTCNGFWCPTGQVQLHPETLLLVPLGLAVMGYSFRRQGGVRPGNSRPIGAQAAASRALPIAVVIAIVITAVLSVNAATSLAVASQAAAGSRCAIEVPSGSTVDPSAGRIVLSNGSVVAITRFPCSMTSVVWGTTGNAAIGQYMPLALAVVATTVLLYLAARRRPMRDVEPPSVH